MNGEGRKKKEVVLKGNRSGMTIVSGINGGRGKEGGEGG